MYLMYVWIMIIFVISLIIHSNFTINPPINVESFNPLLTHTDKIHLYRCLLTFHEICEREGLIYNIAFGTLLGAVRHRELIPWDDDIDLLIYHKDKIKLDAILKEMEKFGYKIDISWKLIRIYATDKLFIDLFLIEEEDGKIIRCEIENKICTYPDKNHDWWWRWFDFDSKFLKDRKRYHFGGLSLWGPTHPMNLLKFWYGDDCLTKCRSNPLVNHTAQTQDIITEDCPTLPEPQI